MRSTRAINSAKPVAMRSAFPSYNVLLLFLLKEAGAARRCRGNSWQTGWSRSTSHG